MKQEGGLLENALPRAGLHGFFTEVVDEHSRSILKNYVIFFSNKKPCCKNLPPDVLNPRGLHLPPVLFNLRQRAEFAKQEELQFFIYNISPQIWAGKTSRVKNQSFAIACLVFLFSFWTKIFNNYKKFRLLCFDLLSGPTRLLVPLSHTE